jgi:hypothetical protein
MVKIKTLSGHLTAREKQLIAHAKAQGWGWVKSARLSINIQQDGEAWRATTTTNETDDYGRKIVRKSSATFAYV